MAGKRVRSRETQDVTAWLDHKWRETTLSVVSRPAGFPPPLHWLKGWSVRLAAIVDEDQPVERLDGWAYRPDQWADEALAPLGVRYPQPIGQIREYLAYADDRYQEFLSLLPPEGCPNCRSADDFEDIDPRQIDPLFRREVVGLSDMEMRTDEWRVRRCFECGKATKIRIPNPAESQRIEQAGWDVIEAVARLSHFVAVAVQAIDEAEKSVAVSVKPKRKRGGGTGRDPLDSKIIKQLLRRQPEHPKAIVCSALTKDVPGISSAELKARTNSILRAYYRDMKQQQ